MCVVLSYQSSNFLKNLFHFTISETILEEKRKQQKKTVYTKMSPSNFLAMFTKFFVILV